MNAIMSKHFPSQLYERDYVMLIKVETDPEHASPDAIHATHLSCQLDNHLEVKCSTPDFTAVITALHLKFIFE